VQQEYRELLFDLSFRKSEGCQMIYTSVFEMLARILLALVCGAVMGWERELQQKPAGLRTHMLISLGSAVFTLLLLAMARESGEPPTAAVDGLKGIIGGIGFLGAGAIIQSRGSVRGLTTATTMWVVGAAGMACGLGQFTLAIVTVGIAAVIAAGLGYLEAKFIGNDEQEDNE
jgi:putative Mg2+ transporter-C (MgtC) family protein